MEYNAPFFGVLSAVFTLYRERHGEEEALKFMSEVFSSRLKTVYDKLGFRKGNPEDFARVVGENDGQLGLKAELGVSESKIVYRFYTDPFPLLKREVDAHKLDDTYMRFKVSYLLGDDWSYSTTNHLWNGDKFTEHVIEKR